MNGPRVLIRGWMDFPGGPEQVEMLLDARSGIVSALASRGEIAVPPDTPVREYDASARILPGDVNAHSHPEQSVYVDHVDPSWGLAEWCRKTIYRHSVELSPEHIRLGCCRAFSRMLARGVTTAVVSFYCHNRRGNELDREVIRAARDTGIRLYFGRMHYDLVLREAYPEKKASQESYYETIAAYETAFLELFTEVGDDPMVAVAPSLHSFHANSLEAIAHGIRLGADLGRLVQFHLSEDEGDVALCLDRYGMRPVQVLDRLVHNGEVPGLSHLLVSDGIWTDSLEKDLMAAHGIRLVLDPRMNRRMKAGRADLSGYLERNVALYLGTDGEASNEDLSIEGERRFLANDFPEVDPVLLRDLGRRDFPFSGCRLGNLAPGYCADLKIVDAAGVRDVYVGGRLTVSGGKLLTLDPARDIEDPLRELLSGW
jgi:5-methylthioadenosine/S-adenosylhomocysteine deaminase